MPAYNVNATISYDAWVYVEADSPEEAVAIAEGYGPGDFDYDSGAARVELCFPPSVDEVPF